MSTEAEPAQLPTPDPEPVSTADAGSVPVTEDAPAAEPPKEEPVTTDGTARPPSSRRSGAAKPSAPPPASKSKPADKKAPASSAKPKSGAAATGSKKGGVASGSDDKSFKIGDIVGGRVKGYPFWPGRIADQDKLPRAVLQAKPGKNPNIHCVQFFNAGDFSWLGPKDIQHYSTSDIESFLEGSHRSTGKLRDAYETALNPAEWIERYDAGQLDAEDVEAGEDELDEDDEGEATGKKRKTSGGSKAPKSKKAKTEKPKAEAAAPKSKGKAAPKSKAESKAAAPKSENKAEPADDDPLASDPECVKVKEWRHKLQRAFLGKGLPTAEEMPTYDEIFTTIEQYDKMSVDALTYSKIGKVMKKIAALEGIPRNDDFKLTDRASTLMNQWSTIVDKDGQANGDA